MLIKAACMAIVAAVGLGMVAFGLFLLAFAVDAIVQCVRGSVQAHCSRRWQAVRGTVLRSVVTRHRVHRMTTFDVRIAYSYEAGGRHYTSTRHRFASELRRGHHDAERARELVARLPTGGDVTVFFDPKRPQSATLDRRRPGLLLPLLLAALATFGAVSMLAAGWHIASGPWVEPPLWNDAELPPLSRQFGGLLLAGGVVLLVVAKGRARRAAVARGLQHRLAAVTATRIVDVVRNRDVAIFGRVEVDTASTLPAPVTGQPVVHCRTRMLDAGDVRTDAVCQCHFHVRDETGRMLVSTEGGSDLLPVTKLPVDDAARAFVDASLAGGQVPVPEQFVLWQSHLAPGDPVLIVGRATRDRATRALVLRANGDSALSLIVAAEPFDRLVTNLTRQVRQGRRLALCGAAAVLLGLVLWLA